MTIQYVQKLASILDMLENINQDLDLVGYNETEKKIFYTIVNNIHNNKKCNITDVIQVSGFSRSTVYKAIKEFENQGLVTLIQSDNDRREVFLDLGIV
jgi:DNA-binding MarR family transcriptional regulator